MTQFTVPAARLRSALITALAFAEQDDDEYPAILGYVHFAPDGDSVVVSATDRYAASREVIKTEGDVFTVVVPSGIAADVVGLIGDPADDPYAEQGLATFVRDGGGEVTIRVVDQDRTVAVTYRPEKDPMFPDLNKVFAPAEKDPSGPAAGIHLVAERLARVAAAMRDRSDIPIEVVAGAPDKAVVLAQGSDFKALVMSVKVRYSQ
jgi:hypothetical protein